MKKIVIFIFLILFFIVGISSYSQETTPIQDNGYKQTKSNKDTKTTDKRHAVTRNMMTRINSNVNSTISKDMANQKEKYDNSQVVSERVMLATVVIAIFAAFQFFAMILQYCVMRKQARELRESVNAAKKSADAAQRSAESLPIIEGAHIFVEVEEDKIRNISETANLFDFHLPIVIRVGNYGRTPAIIGKFLAFADFDAVINTPREIWLRFWHDEKIIIPGTLITSGKPIHQTAQIKVAHDAWGKILAGQKNLHCWGSINYKDVFDNTWEVGFDWQWEIHLECFIVSTNKNLNYHKQQKG